MLIRIELLRLRFAVRHEVDIDAELIAQRDGYTTVQIPEAILRKVGRVARPIAVQRRGIAMVDHADVDDRVLTDRLRQKRKGKRALLLFEVDAFDLVAVLRDQVDSRAKMSETLLLMPAIWFERLFCTL